MKNILLIETLSEIFGGQKMSMLVSDMLSDSDRFRVVWAIPSEGPLAEVLRRKGYPVYYLGDLSLPAGVKGMGAAVKYGGMSLRAMRRLLSIMRKEQIDIVYAPGPASLPWSAVCGTLKKKPVVWHIHHIFEDGMTKKLLNICCRLPAVKKVIAVSKAASGQIEHPAAQRKLAVFYNPIDYSRYSRGNGEMVKTCEPFLTKISGERSMVFEQIGLIHESKNQGFTVDLVASLVEKGENAYGILIGSAPEDGKAYLEALTEKIESLELQNRIFFVGQQNNVQDWLTQATAVTVPSMEGLSLVAMEAMAAGVLVIAVNKYGVGEIVRENNAGMLFDNTIDTNKLLKLLNEPKTMAQIRRNGVEFAKKNDFERYSENLISLFGGLVRT